MGASRELLDRLRERRVCLPHERCPIFNWKENARDAWVILVLEITFALQTHVNFSVDRYKLSTHVGIISVMDFEILISEKLVLLIL